MGVSGQQIHFENGVGFFFAVQKLQSCKEKFETFPKVDLRAQVPHIFNICFRSVAQVVRLRLLKRSQLSANRLWEQCLISQSTVCGSKSCIQVGTNFTLFSELV